LGLLIVARILQGAGGGALQPIAQAVLMESFPTEKRGSAMAVFGMGVVVAPIIGPTLGGWITDNYSWRWIFYINIPVGILAVFMANMFIEDPPYIRDQRPGRIDRLGFALMAIGLGTLQLVLDKGQEEDWFASKLIMAGVIFTCVTLVAFVIWELTTKEPIVDLRVLKNRNFTVGTGLMTGAGCRSLRDDCIVAAVPANTARLSRTTEWYGGKPARLWVDCFDAAGGTIDRQD
jgi:DHA2 family multidrug resistance protein